MPIRLISMPSICWVAAIIFILFSIPSISQDPVSFNYSTTNGLPSNTVYNITQDEKGYIWIAHDRGLCRYDGVSFLAFKANMPKGRSLTNLMHAQQSIWAQDFTGNFYTPQLDSLKAFQLWSGVRPYFAVSAIIKGKILVALGYDSIRTYDFSSGKNRGFPMPGEYQTAVIAEKNRIIFVANNSLISFDGEKIDRLFSWPNKIPQLFFLQETASGFVGFTQNTYPFAYKLTADSAVAIPLFDKGTLIQEVNATNNQIWVSTSRGAHCFDKALNPMYGGHCFFRGRSISRITCDREGTYWFSSLDKGIFKVPNLETRLYAYNDEAITALTHQDSENILAGTSGQRLISFSAQTGKFINLYKNEANHEIINILHEPERKVTLFCSDKIIRLKNYKFLSVVPKAGKSLVSVAQDQYVMAFSNGIGFLNFSASASSLPNWADSLQFLEAMGSFRGRLVTYNPTTQVLLAATTKGLFYIKPGGKGSIYNAGQPLYAACMVEKDGYTYISTYQGAVFLLSPDLVLTPLYTPPKNLVVNKLQCDGSHIWMLTDKGVIFYDTLSRKESSFSIADGLPKAEYKDLLLHKNYLYIASSVGLVAFNHGLQSNNKVPPLLAIDKILVNGIPATNEGIKKLASDRNNLTIGFSVLAYKSEDELNIRYKVNNQNWQTVSAGIRNINLMALSAGTYNLTIVAENEDGVECNVPLVIGFTIAAPVFLQPWFVTGAILLLFVSILWYYNQKLKRQKLDNEIKTQQMQLEQDLQQSKLTSIRSQMNPHFFFNALNTIQSYIYTNDKVQATSYLNKFSGLTRLILELSNKDLISLEDELKALGLYLELEAERFGNKLHYEIKIAPDLRVESIKLPPMLIQPYVENAIKHGLLHSKTIWNLKLSFSEINNGLFVEIDDNGVGRKKSEQLNKARQTGHQSFAMSANQSRLEILNKGLTQEIGLNIIDKTDSYGQPTGTRVELFIPERIWRSNRS